MSLLIILSSLTILFICFESNCALWAKIAIVLHDVLFHSILENKSFYFRRSYSKTASLITFIAYFLNSSIQERLSYIFTLLRAVYICLGLTDFFFSRSKSITLCSRLKPCTLWTVDAQANIKGNWMEMLMHSLLESGLHVCNKNPITFSA